jgi:hypothetical protein
VKDWATTRGSLLAPPLQVTIDVLETVVPRDRGHTDDG